MAPLVRPFAALRPLAEHAAAVIAPPYDVVSTEEARALVRDRPSSFLHISRPEIDLPPGAAPYSDEAYARGAANFARLRDTVLVREREPSYYVYRMRVGEQTQTGVACVLSVAAYEAQRIRKHELTRPDKENDRVRNIATLSAQTGPVLCAYRANDAVRALLRASAAAPPLLEAVGPNQVLHTIWRVSDPARVAAFSNALDALDALYIADGHHRAAAAARVARQRQTNGAAISASDYFLGVLFPHDELEILDYNRVVRDLNGMSAERFLQRVSESFAIEPLAAPRSPPRPRMFTMYLAGQWYSVTSTADASKGERDDPIAALDVSVLHDRLIAPVLNVGDPRTDARVDFVGGIRGLTELARRVDVGSAAVAFALHPPSMDELMAVADRGLVMPPKSTWFEPKLADGLLTHVLD
jgi:uncharacterized protein (DUF1015 family)